MFAYLFSVLVQLGVAIGVAVLLYQIFISDWIKAKRLEIKNAKSKYESLEKIAQVKMVSDEPKDIERFITENAQYLSAEMVAKLVSRIEMIKTDRVIDADTLLKKRIDALEDPVEIEEEPVVVKRASRKR